jgi:hypothetical protein
MTEQKQEGATAPVVETGMVVYKYAIPEPTGTGRAFIDLSASAELLSVAFQGDTLVVWALIDPAFEPEPGYAVEGPRRLIVANTGQPIPGFPDGARFLGTATHPESGIVWHVWDGDAETTA